MRILFLLTLLFSFSCCQRLSPPWNPPLDPPEVPIRDVWAVKDGKAELPCDIAPPDPTDKIYLVLWYREPAGKPLYSFDLRGKPPNAGKHWSAEPTFGFGQRANFRVPAAESNTALVIKDVSLMDEGVYRCRVDYRNSPTRNMKLNLTVVEIYLDTNEKIENGVGIAARSESKKLRESKFDESKSRKTEETTSVAYQVLEVISLPFAILDILNNNMPWIKGILQQNDHQSTTSSTVSSNQSTELFNPSSTSSTQSKTSSSISGCPAGWKYYSPTNMCYKGFDQQKTITWMEAQFICRQYCGDLAIIHDEKTNDFVNAIAYGARIWIGAHRVGPAVHENNQLSWIDGTPLDYSKWASNEIPEIQNPDNWEGSEFCVFSYGYSYWKTNTWNDYDCYSKSTYQIKNFVCQSDGSLQCQASMEGCPDGWTYHYKTSRCYKKFEHTGISWTNAQQSCRLYGGNLAMIYDESTNTFINDLIEGSKAWIGAIRVGPLVEPKPRNDQWTWIDGSPLDYSNWVYNQPDDTTDENCGMINRWKNEGLWNDDSCNSIIANYVCQL